MRRKGERCGRIRRILSTSSVRGTPGGLLVRSLTAASGRTFGGLGLGPASAATTAACSATTTTAFTVAAFAGVVALDDAVGEIEVGRCPHHAGLVSLEDQRVPVRLAHAP